MTARRNRAALRALALPVIGAVIMIVAAYIQPWNGLDLLGWVIFIVGMIRFGRNPGRIRREGRS